MLTSLIALFVLLLASLYLVGRLIHDAMQVNPWEVKDISL